MDFGGSTVGFQEISGFDQETEVYDYIAGDFLDSAAPLKFAGRTKYSDSITAKRGLFKGDTEIMDWLNAAKIDPTAKRTLIITLLDEQQNPLITWTIINAWPSKIDGLSLSAAQAQAAVEQITFQHEGYTTQYHS